MKQIKSRKLTHIVIPALLLLALIGTAWVAQSNKPLATPELPQPPLKELAAQHGVQLGNHAILNRIGEKPYNDILTQQFNLALADNTPNWYFTDGGMRPTRDTYNFKHMDQVMEYAERNHMPVQAHHFVWGEEKWLPDWLKNGNYNKEQLLDIIHDHIQTVGSKYAGRVQEWTVVNEAFTRAEHPFGLHDWWADHTGDQEYIDKSFIWARQADPHAKLILNDLNNESYTTISDTMYNYIKDAKARGVPIDGIGMQMHIDGSHPPQKDEVVKNMQRFGALGVGVYVTEFDVNMHDVKADPKDRQQIQANIYYEMMRACIESKVCKSFSILGISDRETWYNYMGFTDGDPLPFDRQYKPKPAFYSFRDALLQK